MSVNPAKTELVIFSRKHKILMPRVLRLEGHALEPLDKIKDLGVILDRKLFWKVKLSRSVQKHGPLFGCVGGSLGGLGVLSRTQCSSCTRLS